MRKITSMLLVIAVLMSAVLIGGTVGVVAETNGTNVTVTSEAELLEALNAPTGGVINVSGTVAVGADFMWPGVQKSVTITGGTLDFSAVDVLYTCCDVTFDNITIVLKEDSKLYASGRRVTINENVTVNGVATIYGGGNSETINGDTNITILSGTYKNIFGAGYRGTVKGNTNVYIGGNVNANVDWTSHDEASGYRFFGGGNKCNVLGSTNITVMGNAKANYIYGGSTSGYTDEKSFTIGGGTYVTFGGNAKAMSINGGGHDIDPNCNATVVMTGGEVYQIFGGNQYCSLTGNATIKLLGGTVKRRVYGGCYNNYAASFFGGSWDSSYAVSGKITVIIGENVSLPLNADDDCALVACSRMPKGTVDEDSTIIFASQNAKTKHNSKLGVLDSAGKWMYGSKTPDAADTIHTMTYTVDGATVTETCTSCATAHSATATLTLTEASPKYYGQPVECVEVVYSNGWLGGEVESFAYANNNKVGTATATATVNGKTATISFEIKALTTFNQTYTLSQNAAAYSSNNHYVMSYSANNDGSGNTSYNWDSTSGITSYGALVGAAAPVANYNGYTTKHHRLVLRGAANENTNANGGITFQTGWTYTITVKFAYFSAQGWSDYPALALGAANNANQARPFAEFTPATTGNLAGDCFRPNKNSYAPNIVSAQNKATLTTFDSVAEAFGTWIEQKGWKTYTQTITIGEGSQYANQELAIILGSNNSGCAMSNDATWDCFSQFMINEVAVTATPPVYAQPEKVTFNGAEVEIVAGKVTVPTVAGVTYWTNANGDIIKAGDEIAAADGDAFTVGLTDNKLAAGANVSSRNDGTVGIRTKGVVSAEATEVGFAVIPMAAAKTGALKADWFMGSQYTVLVDATGLVYEETADGNVYQVCLKGLPENVKAEEFMFVIYAKVGDVYEYSFLAQESFDSIEAKY